MADKPGGDGDLKRYRDDVRTIREVLITVGLSLEMTAYLRNCRRNALPFWSRDFVRVLSGLVGSTLVLVFLVVVLFQAGAGALVPTVLLLGLAVFFFLFGQHPSYSHLSMIGFLALVGALFLYLFQPDKAVAGLMCGIVAAACMTIAGVISGRSVHTV